ncbi:hypothetical protein BaRGS_00012302, partial [Batillaria attramentaria]
CTTCKRVKRDISCPGEPATVLESTAEELLQIKNKDEKRKKFEEFHKCLNARINAGGGTVCVHIDKPHRLGSFDEKIDDRMMELIPDDSLFSQNFERHYLPDKKHVLFRVIPRPRHYLSTLNFNTTQSLNKGLSELTHGQMRSYLKELKSRTPAPESPGAEPEVTLKFERKKEVMIVKGKDEVHFQESICMQAKSVDEKLALPGGNAHRIVDLAKYFWEGTSKSLPHYISAFTKLTKGGSVYFGVSEGKGTGDHNDVATGSFICDGVELNDRDCEDLKKLILRYVREKMMWIPGLEEHCNPVDVKFHEVKKAGCLFVIEVAVKYFHGVAFYNPEEKKQPRQGDPDDDRGVIVRTNSRKSLYAVLSNRRKLRNSRVVTAEDLIVSRYQLLKKWRNHDSVESAWSSNSKILVLVGADKRIREIKTADW